MGGQTGKRREKPEVQKSAGGGEKSPSAGSGPIRGPELPLVEGPPPQESVKAQDWRRGEGAGSPSFSFVQCIGSLRLTDRTEGGGIVPGCECPYQSCCCCFELKKKKKTMVRVFPQTPYGLVQQTQKNEGDESGSVKPISPEVVVTAKTNKTFPKCIFVISPGLPSLYF